MAPMFEILLAKIKCSKICQTPRSRSQGQKFWYPRKGLVTRILLEKNQDLVFTVQKSLARLKLSKRRTHFKIKFTRSNMLVLTINTQVKYQSSNTHG